MILNLTQHPASPEQIEAGVVDLTGERRAELVRLLTIEALPKRRDLFARSRAIVALAAGWEWAMIGGAPYLMAPLEAALRAAGLRPVYAFSRRESVEETQPDGSVRKVATFRHAGFVEA